MATAQHTPEATEPEQTPDLEKRTRRALEEYITILPDTGNGDGETIVTAVSSLSQMRFLYSGMTQTKEFPT